MAFNKNKKIVALDNVIVKLKEDLAKERTKSEKWEKAAQQISDIAQAILLGIALRYGEKKEEDGEFLGYRLVIDKVNVTDLEKYDTKTSENPDNPDELVIAVLPKETKEDAAED